MACGQTGSGKTHTMLGGISEKDPSDHDGIAARAIRDVFGRIEAMSTHNRVTVKMSYLEIYNENVRDLLTDGTNPPDLILHDTKDGGGVVVKNLTWKCVESPTSVSDIMKAAGARRATGSTAMNAESSRSHAICTLSIHMKHEGESEEIRAKLTLVDLAGSERIKSTKPVGYHRITEGSSINMGLLVLGQVVSALSKMSQQNSIGGIGRVPHFPYRDSKLTRLLQDSLGGNSKTVMVACVSPADTNLKESRSTLQYALRARNIKNSAIRNIVDSYLFSVSEAATLRDENQKLKLQILQFQAQSNLPTIGHSASSAMFQFIPLLSSAQYSNDGKEESMDIDNPFSRGFIEADASKENDERFVLTQRSLKRKLVAMSGTIEEKGQMLKQISIDREQFESMKAAMGALHEADTRSKERDELLSYKNVQIKGLEEKLANLSNVLLQTQAETNDDKRKIASLERTAAVNAAEMLKIKDELARETAARTKAIFNRNTDETKQFSNVSVNKPYHSLPAITIEQGSQSTSEVIADFESPTTQDEEEEVLSSYAYEEEEEEEYDECYNFDDNDGSSVDSHYTSDSSTKESRATVQSRTNLEEVVPSAMNVSRYGYDDEEEDLSSNVYEEDEEEEEEEEDDDEFNYNGDENSSDSFRSTCTPAKASKTLPSVKKAEEHQLLIEDPSALPSAMAEGEEWRNMYERLIRYKKKYHDCNVPRDRATDRKLGEWVAKQRYRLKRQKKSQLTVSRIAYLDKLDFDWKPQSSKWKKAYKDLKKYKNEYGDCNVPYRYKTDRKLGNWVAKQRHQYNLKMQNKKSELSDARIKLLNKLGFNWVGTRGGPRGPKPSTDVMGGDALASYVMEASATIHHDLKEASVE